MLFQRAILMTFKIVRFTVMPFYQLLELSGSAQYWAWLVANEIMVSLPVWLKSVGSIRYQVSQFGSVWVGSW